MSDVHAAIEPPHRPALPPGAAPVAWIRFGCPRCGKRNKSLATLAGTPVCCAKCHGTMIAPAADAADVGPAAAGAVPAKPTLDDLSSHVAARGRSGKRRRGVPAWLVAAHLALPIATLGALWYLRQTGHLPWVEPYLEPIKRWLNQP